MFLLADLSSIPLPHRVFTWPLGPLALNIFYGHFHSLKLGHGGVLPVGQGQALHQGGLWEGEDGQSLELSTAIRTRKMDMSSLVRAVSISHYLAVTGILRTQLCPGSGAETS